MGITHDAEKDGIKITMKTIICKCNQCLLTRKHSKLPKSARVQTYEVRAARSRVKKILKDVDFNNAADIILPEAVVVDYYA
jgi:hypothetical protein